VICLSIFFYIFNRYKDQTEWGGGGGGKKKGKKKKKKRRGRRRRRRKETVLAISYQSQLTPSPNYN